MGQMRANGIVKLRPGQSPLIFPLGYTLGDKGAVIPMKVAMASKNPLRQNSEVTYYYNAGAPGTVTAVATTILKDKKNIVYEKYPPVDDKASRLRAPQRIKQHNPRRRAVNSARRRWTKRPIPRGH